jgi:hypothetical protein
MHPVPTACPVCNNQLTVTKLHCHHCQTSIEGQFSLGMLHKLTAEQLRFVETFLVCEGKINRVEQELGLSYPAVRARLQEVVEALGREIATPPTPHGDGSHDGRHSSPSPAPCPPRHLRRQAARTAGQSLRRRNVRPRSGRINPQSILVSG